MYTFSNKLKNTAFTFIIIGFIGILYSFIQVPTTETEAKQLVESSHHETPSDEINTSPKKHKTDHHTTNGSHSTHLLHKLQNKPWSALYVSAFFFMMIALGMLAFYAIQRVAQAGWSPLLFRVIEAITAYLFPGVLIVIIILVLSSMHFNHLFVWMDSDIIAGDKLLQNKSGYLNIPFFLIRSLIYAGGWIAYRYFSRKFSILQDRSSDNRYFKKNFKISATFLIFFLISESMMSWDWIMSLDPHWFSTLFGWYIFAGMFVTSITVLALIIIYLKSKNYLPKVNDSHLHDLAKYMFAFSIFWAYLWFSQFMLIWYANIPEEITYFITRLEEYKLPFIGMFFLNFLFPFLILMNSDYKRVNWFIIIAGLIIIIGHYIDIFNMVMPATVGENWSFGIPETSSFMFFTGLFIFVVFKSLTKAPLSPKRNPFLKESELYHY